MQIMRCPTVSCNKYFGCKQNLASSPRPYYICTKVLYHNTRRHMPSGLEVEPKS